MEIGGRDQVLVLGAGVESVLHTVRIEVITHPGASGIIVDPGRPLGLTFFSDLCGVRAGESTPLSALFNGVGLLGVFWSPRGVPGATVFDGVRDSAVLSFVGVDGFDPARVGVPGADPLAKRLTAAELEPRDRSRKLYSFLYTRGGQGGWPSNGGNRRARLNLEEKTISKVLIHKVRPFS